MKHGKENQGGGGSNECYYALLGVNKGATAQQIKKAYHALSRALHPDKNPYGASLMKQINEAYGTLSDLDARQSYDNRKRSKRNTPVPTSKEGHQKKKTEEEPRKEKDHESRDDTNPPRSGTGRSRESSGPFSPDWYDFFESYTKFHVEPKMVHECGQEIFVTNLKAHEFVCPLRFNQKCFKCTGSGVGDSGTSSNACSSCNGRRYLLGRDWVACFKCKGRGEVMYGFGTSPCTTCNSIGGLQGPWTMCFRCQGEGSLAARLCHTCGGKGAAPGYNVMECAYCTGLGCVGCHDFGLVSCQCGVLSCRGHSSEYTSRGFEWFLKNRNLK